MQQIYVIEPFNQGSPHFEIIGMIGDYYSMLWHIQLYGLGYFEITLPATQNTVRLVTDIEGRFLVRECDISESDGQKVFRNCMIIRRVTTVYDADKGWCLKVSGKSVKDILSQRIILEPYSTVDESLPAVIDKMIYQNAKNPEEYAHSMVEASEEVLATKEAWEATKKDIRDEKLADYERAVADYGEDSPQAKGAKASLDAAQAAYDQAVAERVNAENTLNYYSKLYSISIPRRIPYMYTGDYHFDDPPLISVQLHGENLGEWIESICTELGWGWDVTVSESRITFYFVIGEDRSATVEFSPEMDNLKNAEFVRSTETYRDTAYVFGDGEGVTQEWVVVDGDDGSRRYEDFISAGISKPEGGSDLQYQAQLMQIGQTEIASLDKKETISGEIDTDGVYKIGEDFDLGDVVKVKTEQDVSATTRLIEILCSDETDGTHTIGTFTEWEV
jgi:hypothetical protein